MIDDILQIENLNFLSNLSYINTDNNEFTKINIHQKILSNNLHPRLIIDQSFESMKYLQVSICLKIIYKYIIAYKGHLSGTHHAINILQSSQITNHRMYNEFSLLNVH